MLDYSWSETAENYFELCVIIQRLKMALCGRQDTKLTWQQQNSIWLKLLFVENLFVGQSAVNLNFIAFIVSYILCCVWVHFHKRTDYWIIYYELTNWIYFQINPVNYYTNQYVAHM